MFDTFAGPGELSDRQLAAQLLAASEQVDRARAYQVTVAAEFDARMVYAADGAANAAVWLAPRARISRAEAGQIVNLARKLEHMTLTASAVDSGTLSTAQARVLSRAVNERTASVFAEHEASSSNRRLGSPWTSCAGCCGCGRPTPTPMASIRPNACTTVVVPTCPPPSTAWASWRRTWTPMPPPSWRTWWAWHQPGGRSGDGRDHRDPLLHVPLL